MPERSIVTVVSGEPSTRAASVECGSLVGPGLVEPDRERRDRLAAMAAAKAEDDRRVEAAADIADDRHVAAQPALDGLLEQRLELVDRAGSGRRAGVRIRRRESRGPSSGAG